MCNTLVMFISLGDVTHMMQMTLLTGSNKILNSLKSDN